MELKVNDVYLSVEFHVMPREYVHKVKLWFPFYGASIYLYLVSWTFLLIIKNGKLLEKGKVPRANGVLITNNSIIFHVYDK